MYVIKDLCSSPPRKVEVLSKEDYMCRRVKYKHSSNSYSWSLLTQGSSKGTVAPRRATSTTVKTMSLNPPICSSNNSVRSRHMWLRTLTPQTCHLPARHLKHIIFPDIPFFPPHSVLYLRSIGAKLNRINKIKSKNKKIGDFII